MTDQRDRAAPAQATDWDQVFEAISDPMAILTPDYRVVRANAAYLAWQGTTRERCEGSRCFAHYASGTAPCEDCGLPLTVASGKPQFARTVQTVQKGTAETGQVLGPRVYETWTYPVHDADGTVVHVVEIIKDVTEREQLAQVTRETEALREAEQLKSELLGTVSHELRSPLASIKGYAATLLKHERRLSTAERHEFLQAIVDSSDRLEAVIDRMLEMSQLESGALRLMHTPVNLEHLVREALIAAEGNAAAHTLGRHDFSFEVTPLARGVDRYIVSGDGRRLRQVLDHLLENAVKYSPEGGSIKVALRPAMLAWDRAKERATSAVGAMELEVRDDGIGIPGEHLDRIFDRFHRVDTRLTRVADGLGLGLAIARRVVELHGGKIWVESTSGVGSAFHILLPLISLNAGTEDESGVQIEDETKQSRDQHGRYALPDVIGRQLPVTGMDPGR